MLAQLYRLSRIHLQSGHFSLYSLLPPPVTEELQCWCSEQELGGGAGLYWYWQRRGHLTLQLPCTARTLTDSHHQENCTLGLRQPLHEEATLKLQIANNKGEAGVHLLNSGSFHSSGTL